MTKSRKSVVIRLLAAMLSLIMVLSSVPAMSIYAFAQEISALAENDNARLELDFNKNWKFNLGDVSNAYSTVYSDASWAKVSLPHDFSIIRDFTTSNTEGESGSLPGGTGWYRKSFIMPADYADKTFVINFDASYSETTVYVNGVKVGENLYGYNPFSFDLTDYIVCDGATTNVIAVKVTNRVPSSRWYSGSGIIGDVTLTIANSVHVSLYGTQVTTPDLASSGGADGTTNMKITLQNDDSRSQSVTVVAGIINPSGALVAETSTAVTLAAGASTTVSLSADIANPVLWSTTNPARYTMKTTILNSQGNVIDEYNTKYGYTWSAWSETSGFSLNGQNLKLQGVCMHHDQGALGAAQEYDAIYRQLSILKAMGVNSIRTSHNTFSRVYLEICNELGLLVVEEFFDGWVTHKNGNTYDFATYFNNSIASDNKVLGGSGKKWYQFVIAQTIMRDRNDPAIIVWDVGNELDDYNNTTIAADMKSIIDNLDARPMLWGNNSGAFRPIDNYMDLFGGNYHLSDYLSNYSSYGMPFVGTETASAVGSRGVYRYTSSDYSQTGTSYAHNLNYASSSDYQISAYDAAKVGWGNTAADAWYYTITNDWFSGEYVWTGFDYIGEPTPWNAYLNANYNYPYPNSSYFGIVDTAGFGKDSAYLYNAFWDKSETTLHLVPGTWNSSNLVVDANGFVDVAVYTNAPYIELLYNGTVVGKAIGRTNTTSAGYQYITYTETVVDSSKCKVGTLDGSNDHNMYPLFELKYDTTAEITVKAYDREGGSEITGTVGTNKVRSNFASGITVSAWNDDTTLTADGDSFTYVEITAVDSQGNFVNDYNGTLDITLSSNNGAGVIAGVDNGNAATSQKFQSSTALLSDTSARIQMFNGKALVIVQSTEKEGSINVTVTPSGLAAKSIGLTSVPETGSELTDEFEEVIDQTVDISNLDNSTRKEFLEDLIDDIPAPKTDVTYELYTIGSGAVSYVPTGNYIIAGADSSGNTSTGVLGATSSQTGTLDTSGSEPAASSQVWTFVRQSNGKYVISFTGEHVTNEFLNITADGPVIAGEPQELDVLYSNGTVRIGSGSSYITYSSSSANKAGVSSTGTTLRLYTAENGQIARWGNIGLLEDGQYIVYAVTSSNATSGYVMTPDTTTVSTYTGFVAEEATPDGNTIVTDARNEITVTNVDSAVNSYTFRLSTGKYYEIITTDNAKSGVSDTETIVYVDDGGVTNDNRVVVYAGRDSSGKAYLMNLFSAQKMFSQWSQNIQGASGQNELHRFYKKSDASSSADVALYNALKKAIDTNPVSYTQETYAALLDAVQNGYDKLISGTATDAEKNAATTAIDNAFDALERNIVSDTLMSDIASLERPVSQAEGIYLYRAQQGVLLPDGEYVLYATDLSNNARVMTGTAVTKSNGVKGFDRDTPTFDGDKINTSESNVWTITYDSSLGAYTVRNSQGKYLNISSTNVVTTASDTPVGINITILADGRVNIHNGDSYLQNQDTSGNPVFSNWSGNGSGSHEKFTLYRKQYSIDAENRLALYNALQNAAALDAVLYTTASYAALLETLQNAYNVFINDDATDSEIIAATNAVNNAVKNLKYVNLRPVLQSQIASLNPPADSTAEYVKYSATPTSMAYIPDGEYVISCTAEDPNGNNAAWGVMTNTYVLDAGTTWDGMGFEASYSAPTTESDTWLIERDTETGYYHISRLNSSGTREYLYAYKDYTDDNAQMSATTGATNAKTWWTAEIDTETGKVMFRNVNNSSYLITFMGDYAYTDKNVSNSLALYVSIYKEGNNKGGTPLTLQRKENGILVPWYGIPVDEGKYMLTWGVNGTDDSSLRSLTYMMNTAPSGDSGALSQSGSVTINDDRILALSDHQIEFIYLESNLYYIKNGNNYLNIDYNNAHVASAQSLQYSENPQALAVKAYADGRIAVYNPDGFGTEHYVFLDKYSTKYSTWGQTMSGTDNNDYNRHFRLYRFDTIISATSEQQQLFLKLHEAIAINQDNYSDDSYNNLLVAIKNGIDAYNDPNGDWTAAREAIDAAIAALEIAKEGFAATLYKYGYTPDNDYSSGGLDFNNLAYEEMENIIRSSPVLMQQITDIILAAGSAQSFASTTEQNAAAEVLIDAYAKIYTLAFSGGAVRDTGTEVSQHYKTFWNIWQKEGTRAQGEAKNEGASVQGLFSTTLNADGLPTSHSDYSVLPYINTTVTPDTAGNNVAGLSSEVSINIVKNGSSVIVNLPALENVSVYIPDYFSKNVVSGTSETYAKYYWDLQFPFVKYTNNYGVNTYVYDSADRDRVFQASYDDSTHTAQAQLTEKDSAETGAVNGPLVDINGVPQSSYPDKGVGFFPFNNRLDGSNANMTTVEKAIYHFGMSFTTDFYIPTSGTYGDGEDIVFEFSGDDDVLVYIDDVLVLDNGGLHGARYSSINFTDRSVIYQYIADAETGTVTNAYNEGISYTYGEENEGISAQNQAAIEYLNKVATDGQQHTFTFYFLERGSTDSNCKISFNIQKLSDYVKLVDQTYVVDYGLPMEFNIKENNTTSAPEGYDLPIYEYIGVASELPRTANSGVMFTEPTAEEITKFGSLTEMEYAGSFGVYNVEKSGDITYTPQTMQFTDAGSIYLCARVEKDATYKDGTIYYAFEKITIVPATIIYYEDDFEGNAITYTDGSIPSVEQNTANLGLWQTASDIPEGVVKEDICQRADKAGEYEANAYGFDEAYSECATYSGYTSKYVTVSAKNNPNEKYSGGAGSAWPEAEFTFAGTGFDIISVTSKDTGSINLTVTDSEGTVVKNHTVNTYYGYTYGQLYSGASGNPTLTDTGVPLYFTADRKYTVTPTYYNDKGEIVTENTGDFEPAYAMGWIIENAVEDDNALYQIPVVKVEDLDYGTYTVKITPMYSSRMDMAKDGAYEFYLDAVRIYNPAGVGDSLVNATISYTYTQDEEANADYLELRDLLIGTNKLTNDGTSAEGIVFIDGIADNDDVSKYTSGGPNNELYLLENQAVAFEIWASAIPDDVQIGAKAVGNTTPEMLISYTTTAGTYNTTATLRTSTDLYYSVDNLLRGQTAGQLNWTPVTGADGNTYYTSGTVVIQNVSGGIISITNLKWTFPSAGIGYYENLHNGGAAVIDDSVMLMSSYSTFAMARSSVRAVNADLEITPDDVTVENDVVTAGEKIVVTVETSQDVDSLVIRDENGNIVTPEALESFVATVDDEEVKLWTVTLSAADAGTFTYTITGAYENGYAYDTPVSITVTVNTAPAEDNGDTDDDKLTFFEKLAGFFNRIIEFFRSIVAMFSGAII